MPDLQNPFSEPESDTEPFLQWEQGVTVGRYSLLSRLAVGGMAEIWLARQAGPQGFEKFVAIKRVLDSLSADGDFVAMFLDEARLAAQLNHPHIVQIYDLGEEAGAYYIAMEYLPGENLSSVAKACARQQRLLPLTHAARIIADAAEGLAYAHAKLGPDGALLGIVHRDVSPQNILVTYDGVVKVLDFGIAKATTRESQTSVGQVRGKASYMSPEQARGQPLDARSDIFSLGIVLFELLTGTRFFPDTDTLTAMNLLAGDSALPVAHERNPRVPEALSRIIAKALARAPAQRYLSARHLQAALEEWLRGQPEVPDSTELAQYMTRLFGDRIQERARLLDTARAGELTPSSARRVIGRAQSIPSMPNRVITREATLEQPPPPPPLRRRWPWLVVAAALPMLAGAGVLFALKPKPVRAPSAAAARPSPVLTSAAALPPPPVLSVETDPTGARIQVDGHDVGSSPLTLDSLLPGEHAVTATLEGRLPAEQKVNLSRLGERTMVMLALAAPPPPTPAPAPAPVETPPAEAAPARARRAMGRLTLDTTPWTYVHLRGRKLGDTPIIELPLPAGRHQLKLVNEAKNISTVVEVEIRAGQVTSKKLRL